MKKKKDLEPESSLEDSDTLDIRNLKEPIPIDRLDLVIQRLDQMAQQYNGFVKTVSELQNRTDQMFQMIIRPPEPNQTEQKDGEEKKTITDSRSKGISETMGKKVSDATLHEIIEAGDLALRVHDRRQGLTDLEEFMVGVGKDTMVSFGSAQSHKRGVESV